MVTPKSGWKRVAVVTAVAVGLLAGQANAATVLWKSKLLVVTKNGARTVFQNRTEHRIRYACAWATSNGSGSPYITDGTTYVLDARGLRPLRSYYWTDPNPAAVQCAVKETGWPPLPLLRFDFAVSEYESSSLQVLSQPQCASNCDYSIYFQNRGAASISYSCSWTILGLSESWSGSLDSYGYSTLGTGKPDDGSMSCSV